MLFKMVLAFFFFLAVISAGRTEVHVNFIRLNNFTEYEKSKIMKSAKVIEAVLNSKEFKKKVIDHTYEGKRMFVDTSMTNEMVYETIMKGAEIKYMPTPNGKVDLSLTMYYSIVKTVGYTYADSDTVWLNRKFHNNYTEYEQPSNIVHEWTHKLGFTHAAKWSKSRDYSVPYAVGSIVTELAKVLKTKPSGLTPLTTPIPPTAKMVPVVCTRSWKTFFKLVCK